MSETTRSVPVTAIVLTYNEEKNLRDCLNSLASWVQDIFVVDSGSTDATREIARSHGARVVEHGFDDYGTQRNWALASLPIETPWVLNIDADERVSPELRAAIERVTANRDSPVLGYLIARRTMFMGQWIKHGGHYPVWHLRLFRTGRGRCEPRLYDQHFVVEGRVEKLSGDLIDVLTSDIATFSVRHIRWATLEAREQEERANREQQVEGRFFGGNPIQRRRRLRAGYGRAPLFIRVFAYFLYRYIIRLGFLDGRAGFIFHFLQGCWYRFLVDALIYERRSAGQSR